MTPLAMAMRPPSGVAPRYWPEIWYPRAALPLGPAPWSLPMFDVAARSPAARRSLSSVRRVVAWQRRCSRRPAPLERVGQRETGGCALFYATRAFL